MATKKEIFTMVTTAVAALCTTHKTPTKFNDELQAILAANLEPKAGGATVNLDEVTRKDKDGNIVEIQCSVSGAWLPATKEFFYEDKAGKGINGLKRLSRQAESIRKHFIKVQSSKCF